MQNIVLIIANDLGQHIGPYGIQTVNTPCLDRMAREGVLFEQSFYAAPAYSPLRASIFVGLGTSCSAGAAPAIGRMDEANG